MVTIDGYGTGLAGSISLGEGGTIKRLHSLRFPYSLGTFYETVTSSLGFKPDRHAGKIVGLAAYGDPSLLSDVLMTRVEETPGDFKLVQNLNVYFSRHLASHFPMLAVAAAYQHVLEQLATRLIAHWVKETGVENVVLSGGVTANVKMNQRIHEVDGVLECRWRGEPGWSDANTSLHLVGTTPVFMNIPNGVLHTSSMSGYCMPTWSLEGLDERTIALLVYESALQSQAEGARGFCQLNPEAMAMLGRGALQYEEMRPIGYLRNAILLSLLSLFAFCTVRGRADLWLERVTKAIGPPQRDPKACPACGSDIHGLDKCPECGREI